jgi:hypothetical protein
MAGLFGSSSPLGRGAQHCCTHSWRDPSVALALPPTKGPAPGAKERPPELARAAAGWMLLVQRCGRARTERLARLALAVVPPLRQQPHFLGRHRPASPRPSSAPWGSAPSFGAQHFRRSETPRGRPEGRPRRLCAAPSLQHFALHPPRAQQHAKRAARAQPHRTGGPLCARHARAPLHCTPTHRARTHVARGFSSCHPALLLCSLLSFPFLSLLTPCLDARSCKAKAMADLSAWLRSVGDGSPDHGRGWAPGGG